MAVDQKCMVNPKLKSLTIQMERLPWPSFKGSLPTCAFSKILFTTVRLLQPSVWDLQHPSSLVSTMAVIPIVPLGAREIWESQTIPIVPAQSYTPLHARWSNGHVWVSSWAGCTWVASLIWSDFFHITGIIDVIKTWQIPYKSDLQVQSDCTVSLLVSCIAHKHLVKQSETWRLHLFTCQVLTGLYVQPLRWEGWAHADSRGDWRSFGLHRLKPVPHWQG